MGWEVKAMSYQQEILSLIDQYTQDSAYQALHWEGAMADYLEILRQKPEVLRDAFQRIYEVILSYGTEECVENKEKLVRYRFFSDPDNGGADAVFGLEQPLMHLVNIFKSASRHYGTERRILLLHGPVGSAKSTIVRLLKKGLETCSRKPEGALYSFAWHMPDPEKGEVVEPCPMHEEPLHLFPRPIRDSLLRDLGTRINGG
jgi:serine protein kinase